MTARRRLLGALGGAVGLAAAGTAIGLLRQQRAVPHDAGVSVPFGSLRSAPITVVADDGLPLHVEVDEVEQPTGRGKGRAPAVTVVFAHGYCLNLDSWHFQRAAYRGLVRAVYYDQRSHGRSGRTDREHATIDQLGHDLRAVIDQVVPDGPVVVVGHSMGGMTVCALAEHYPEMIGDKIIGVSLVSTTAGGLDPSRILLPMLPARLTYRAARRAVATLAVGHGAVDQVRRVGRYIANAATQRFAFGGDVPRSYVTFVDDMLSATPFEVVADFFPSFGSLDKFDHVAVLDQVPVSIISGTHDKLTSIGHSRKLHSRIPSSRLVECEGAGHMVPIERHDQVNAELDQLITAATTRAASR
ncbi:alpha/beta fold hydrolase [Nocardioides rubriscoriae]|uniref:alpha/beta fold hydrolase n=1 Tax=Nocardioides rubriscoriae TaxID=642762 RepID=UPI0011E02D03|nr:alpha/beta hydrolase [Nocardioides rubriscoriae]